MRLLLFAQQFRDVTSGLGTYARGLVTGLIEHGHEVTLACPGGQALDVAGLRIVPMDFRPGNVTPFSFRRMARAHRAALDANAGRHDLVHFLDAREAVFLEPVKGGPPAIGTVHDTYALDWLAKDHPRHAYGDRLLRALYYRWLRRLEPRAYRRLARVLANSDHVALALARGYEVPGDRIEVVRLGLPDPGPVEPEPLPGDPSILFVGGNYQRKGLPALISALARTALAQPEARLHVVGRDARPGRFTRMARVLNVADRVEFHGWQPPERVRALMAGSDVFAMPSLVEAFGLVYLEAMWAGTPVIATSRGGAPECFRDGEEALLVAPGDVESLAEALGRLADDLALRKRLVEGGRAVAARLTLDATV
ncbi:MAG: glycosyltransferase family 4 protein, partial [Planctomycetota bacterium]